MSAKFDIVKKYYDLGLWSVEKVKNAVAKEWITVSEYQAVTGEEYN